MWHAYIKGDSNDGTPVNTGIAPVEGDSVRGGDTAPRIRPYIDGNSVEGPSGATDAPPVVDANLHPWQSLTDTSGNITTTVGDATGRDDTEGISQI